MFHNGYKEEKIEKKNLYLLKITQNVREVFELSIVIPVLCLTFANPVIDRV